MAWSGEAWASETWHDDKRADAWQKEEAPATGNDPWASTDSWATAATPADWSKAADADAGAGYSAGATDTGGWGTTADAGGWSGSTWGADTNGQQPTAKEFWQNQEWNKQAGTLSRKEEWDLQRDDDVLFQERLGSGAGIDFSRYDNVPVDVSGEKATQIPVCKTFEEMFSLFGECLVQALVDNIRRCKYSVPTPVQKYVIPVGLVGRDVMCCAQTGSGKTAAFLVPVIGRMMKHNESPVGSMTVPFEGACAPDTLVISPTRELTIQIFEEAQKFCHRTPYIPGILYGGAPAKDQQVAMAKGCDVLVATPGRLKDFIDRGIVSVASVSILVLDEADRMLDMGFEPEVRKICEEYGMKSNEHRQTMMFSATFPEKCQKLAMEYLYNYIWVGVGVVGGAVETVQQELTQVAPKDKFGKLLEVLDAFFNERDQTLSGQDKPRAMVFVNAKDTAKFLDEQLYGMKFDTGALHGNLTQTEREQNLHRFRQGEIDVMIATDVAARGLDIANCSLVINFDMPTEIDSYIHRIGRTGRIGNRGRAVTFVASEDGSVSLENVEVLRSLAQVMRDAGSSPPDWLGGLIDATDASKSGGWSWGGKDVRRDGGGNSWESTTGTGGGDPWGTWNKSDKDSGGDWNNSKW